MAIGTAVGYVAVGGEYVPYKYAPKMMTKWYPKTIFKDVMDDEYKGILQSGATVYIRKRPTITGGKYSKGGEVTYPFVSASNGELTIDETYLWSFGIDDIDAKQIDIGFINDWIDEANKQTAIYTEKLIFNAAPGSVLACNKGNEAGYISGNVKLGTLAEPVHVTKKEDYTDASTGIDWYNAADFCGDMYGILDEVDAPAEADRFTIAPSFFRVKIAQSDIKSADMTGDDTGVIHKGPRYIGKVQGMNIYACNNLTKITTGGGGSTNVFPILFGVREGWTFVGQIDSIKAFDLHTTCGMGHRGLFVFGWAIKIEEGLGLCYVTTDATNA